MWQVRSQMMEQLMLVKLRRRFVLITMLLVGLLLLGVFVANVASTYQTQFSGIQQALSRAIEHGDIEATKPWVGVPPSIDGDPLIDNSNVPPSGDENPTGQRISLEENFVPVFVVIYDHGQGLQTTNSGTVFMDAELIQIAMDEVNSMTNDAGWLSDLGLFYQRVDDTTETRIAFAGATPLYDTLLKTAGTSALVALAAFLTLFGVSLVLSRIALKPVEEAWEKQRRFIADASHELKTPITVILANNNILNSHADQTVASQRQWLNSTQLEALRMEGLIRDLLLLAQTEQDTDALTESSSKSELDLSELVNKTLLQFEAVMFDRHIELHSDISDGINIEGNGHQIERLLTILLDNACKYADEGGTVRVSLHPSAEHQHKATLLIANNGESIAAEDLPHVFERFYRGDASHSNTIEGYGLGLAMAKNLVDAHQGSINVSSTVEAGTTVTVVL